jgi:hypothetical protein
MHRRAEANVGSYRNPAQRCHAIQLHCGDAAEFPLPEDPLVVYFYNPFRADVMRKVLRGIEASLAAAPRPLIAIHLWPRADTRALFAASPSLTLAAASSDATMFKSRAPAPRPPQTG